MRVLDVVPPPRPGREVPGRGRPGPVRPSAPGAGCFPGAGELLVRAAVSGDRQRRRPRAVPHAPDASHQLQDRRDDEVRGVRVRPGRRPSRGRTRRRRCRTRRAFAAPRPAACTWPRARQRAIPEHARAQTRRSEQNARYFISPQRSPDRPAAKGKALTWRSTIRNWAPRSSALGRRPPACDWTAC